MPTEHSIKPLRELLRVHKEVCRLESFHKHQSELAAKRRGELYASIGKLLPAGRIMVIDGLAYKGGGGSYWERLDCEVANAD